MSIAPASVSRRVCLRAEIHFVEARVGAVGERHHDMAAVRRKPRRETHALNVAERLALAAFEVHQRDARLVAAERHVGDLLRGRLEGRRHHELVAVRQIFDVGAVHVHQRDAL